MWYEKDFTIPLFCKKVKFEYDKKSGNYTGKFAISEKQKDSLFDNLKEFNERSVNVTNSIDKYKGNLRDLDKKTLNTTMVSYNLLYKYYFKKEKKRDDIQIDKIYPEEWMLENCVIPTTTPANTVVCVEILRRSKDIHSLIVTSGHTPV